MCKKVIFLDIDGILNPYTNQLENESRGVWRSEQITLNKNAIQTLKKIVGVTGAELVLSSTWRYPENNGTFASKENLEKQLREYGMCISDVTTVADGLDRRGEILSYLNEHTEITHCVVLDDDTDIDAYNDLRRFWVYIDPKFGLQERHITQVMEVFKNEELPENREFETMLRVAVNCESVEKEIFYAAEKQIQFNNIFNAETDNERHRYISALLRHDKEHRNVNETWLREGPKTEKQKEKQQRARNIKLKDCLKDEKE